MNIMIIMIMTILTKLIKFATIVPGPTDAHIIYKNVDTTIGSCGGCCSKGFEYLQTLDKFINNVYYQITIVIVIAK